MQTGPCVPSSKLLYASCTNSIFHVVDLTHPDNDRDRDLERDFGDGVGLTLLCNASQRSAMQCAAMLCNALHRRAVQLNATKRYVMICSAISCHYSPRHATLYHAACYQVGMTFHAM